MARGGCQRAYHHLMERHRAAIYHLMYRMTHNHTDAEDLTLEAFGKAFTRLDSYQPRFAFSTWLYRIAVNNCIDYVRRRRFDCCSIDEPIQSGTTTEYADLLPHYSLNPEEEVIRGQRIFLMRSLLDKLSDKYRTMIELRYFDELSYGEIAERLQLPLGTVKAQLFRAKEILAEMLRGPGTQAWLDIRA